VGEILMMEERARQRKSRQMGMAFINVYINKLAREEFNIFAKYPLLL
jgi:hypothetical protein